MLEIVFGSIDQHKKINCNDGLIHQQIIARIKLTHFNHTCYLQKMALINIASDIFLSV
jgi:hypothetical protein